MAAALKPYSVSVSARGDTAQITNTPGAPAIPEQQQAALCKTRQSVLALLTSLRGRQEFNFCQKRAHRSPYSCSLEQLIASVDNAISKASNEKYQAFGTNPASYYYTWR